MIACSKGHAEIAKDIAKALRTLDEMNIKNKVSIY